MTTIAMTYATAVAAHESAREGYQQVVAAVRQWPFNHDAEHQAPSEAALLAVVESAITLGEAGDRRDAAWRAYKKEAKANG